MQDGDAKRMVDFSAGLVFGLRGTIERVTSKVFLLSPEFVQVDGDTSADEGSFYNQSSAARATHRRAAVPGGPGVHDHADHPAGPGVDSGLRPGGPSERDGAGADRKSVV